MHPTELLDKPWQVSAPPPPPGTDVFILSGKGFAFISPTSSLFASLRIPILVVCIKAMHLPVMLLGSGGGDDDGDDAQMYL